MMKQQKKLTVCALFIYSSLAAVTAEMSYGELIDKITILRIKKSKISEPKKNKNVCHELAVLEHLLGNLPENEQLSVFIDELTDVNMQLWEIEDAIRIKEYEKLFDQEFIDLARRVYLTNDERVRIKREINTLLGSVLQEEKSYKGYANKF
jgi:Family of unknown function (DUF6165)